MLDEIKLIYKMHGTYIIIIIKSNNLVLSLRNKIHTTLY